jgi:hypothetical protein
MVAASRDDGLLMCKFTTSSSVSGNFILYDKMLMNGVRKLSISERFISEQLQQKINGS